MSIPPINATITADTKDSCNWKCCVWCCHGQPDRVIEVSPGASSSTSAGSEHREPSPNSVEETSTTEKTTHVYRYHKSNKKKLQETKSNI